MINYCHYGLNVLVLGVVSSTEHSQLNIVSTNKVVFPLYRGTQIPRALVSGTKGRRFESYRAYHTYVYELGTIYLCLYVLTLYWALRFRPFGLISTNIHLWSE